MTYFFNCSIFPAWSRGIEVSDRGIEVSRYRGIEVSRFSILFSGPRYRGIEDLCFCCLIVQYVQVGRILQNRGSICFLMVYMLNRLVVFLLLLLLLIIIFLLLLRLLRLLLLLFVLFWNLAVSVPDGNLVAAAEPECPMPSTT